MHYSCVNSPIDSSSSEMSSRGRYSHHNNSLDLRRNPSSSDRANHVSVDHLPTAFVVVEFDSYEFVLVKEVDWHLFQE
jgi:hypothetical protein